MASRPRTGVRLLKTLLPLALLLVLAAFSVAAWVTYTVAHPPKHDYLITPERLGSLSYNSFKITDEVWANRDGTAAHGWLLRGAPGAPAVVLLHNYGADRSWLLNLGVKLNETTNFTVLWCDLRGHGENGGAWSSFGAREPDDAAVALVFLRTLKTPQGQTLVGPAVGFYGVELGAYAALLASTPNVLGVKRTNAALMDAPASRVAALALDSVPADSDALLKRTVASTIGINNGALFQLARGGVRARFFGAYKNVSACEAAATARDTRTLLLSGAEAGALRDSTQALAQCFPVHANVESDFDLPVTGLNVTAATSEQGEAYDRRIIEFFNRTLAAANKETAEQQAAFK